MKKYISFVTVFVFLSMFVSNVVFAGGGFEENVLNPDGTLKASMGNGTYTVAQGVMYDENGNVIEQGAQAFSAFRSLGTPIGVGVLAVIVVASGLGYMYWKRNNHSA